MSDFFETASFHIVKPCNMACKFCYATFKDMEVKQIPINYVYRILDKLRGAGLQKITFAGGEPLLYKHLFAALEYSKHIGLTTSIITNGSLLTNDVLENFASVPVDWIGVSVDSLNPLTNKLIGRISSTTENTVHYPTLCAKIKEMGFKLKINTVVNSFNWYADLNEFIDEVKPDRWKVFRALRIEGQNDKQFDEIKVSDEQFMSFVNHHKLNEDMSKRKCMVVEDNQAMTGSYLLIDPQGRLFENSAGKHTYSRPLQSNTIEDCLSDINLNREMFIKRGGIYQW